MLDCLSNGRLISGFARGIPREYQVHNVPLANRAPALRRPSRSSPVPGPRTCSPTRASSGPTRTSRSGRARCSGPIPPIWIPIVGSQESIEFAGRHNIPITPGLGGARGFATTSSAYYAKCLAAPATASRRTICRSAINAYVADSKAQAVKEIGPLSPLLQPHAVQPRQLHRDGRCSASRLRRAELDRLCAAGEPARGPLLREDFRNLTLADVERLAEHLPWGTPREVTERIIAAAEGAGADMVQISLNRGAMPHEMFIEQIRRFAREVLPRLQAHEVKRVPAAQQTSTSSAIA